MKHKTSRMPISSLTQHYTFYRAPHAANMPSSVCTVYEMDISPKRGGVFNDALGHSHLASGNTDC